MHRTRSTVLIAVCTALLSLTAGPAFAGPAPLVPATEGGAPSSPSDAGGGSDPGTWVIVGYTAAGLLLAMVLALAAVTIVRHTHHHAPHPV
jgi:hypothetical protein